jgi:glutathione S-transferase
MTSTPPELFWIAGSPFAWRVMLTLEAKQVPYMPRLLQGSQGDHKKPDFLALNPRGKVPVLRDGDFVLYESIAIMQFIEAKHPARPMFGRAAYETAAIWRSISEFSCYLQPPLVRVYTPLLTGKSQEKAADVLAALPEVHAELAKLEDSLARKAWLAGPGITAADTTAYPFLKVLLRASEKDEAASHFDHLGLVPLKGRYPRLAAWMEKIEQLPGYERTYPPHWRI